MGEGFAGRVAIVTGGGSGIGAAIVRAVAARGSTVVIADIDEPAATALASEINAQHQAATSAAVADVTDAAAVADLVTSVAAEHGRLDLMFNNAGIAVAGLVDQLTLDHWDRVIDVNLRGVVHGVHAAYPVMLRQGHGHIVNTASLDGLVPGPGLAPYVAVKHAVVGLSLSLRAEAALRGVRVSAMCPGFVDTPLLGRVNPGLPQTEAGANAAALARMHGNLYQADLLAQDVLRGVEQNRALIVAPRSARIAWRMSRYTPRFMMRTIISGVRRGAAGLGSRLGQERRTPDMVGDRDRDHHRCTAPGEHERGHVRREQAQQREGGDRGEPRPGDAPPDRRLERRVPGEEQGRPAQNQPRGPGGRAPCPVSGNVRDRGIGRGGDDDPAHHDRVDEVIGRPADPAGIRRPGDDIGGVVCRTVEVHPPEPYAADDSDQEGGDLGPGQALRCLEPGGEARADHDDRLADRDQDEALAALGEVPAFDRPVRRPRPTKPWRVEADRAAEQVDGHGAGPEQRAGVAVNEAARECQQPADRAPRQDALEVAAQHRIADHRHGERAPPDLHHQVRGADDQPGSLKRGRQGGRGEQADHRQREQQQPDRDQGRVEPVVTQVV